MIPERPRYLTMEEIMSEELSLDELLDAPWTYDGRSMREDFRDLIGLNDPSESHYEV